MARHLFGSTGGDFAQEAVEGQLFLRPGATGTVWTALTGGTQLTDLLAADGVTPITSITADGNARVSFYGPDSVVLCYVDFGFGRFALTPIDLGSAIQAAEGAVVATAVQTSRSLTAADRGHPIDVDSMTDVTLTVPSGLPEMITEVSRRGTGRVLFAAGAGVNLRYPASQLPRLREQHSVGALRKMPARNLSVVPAGALLDLNPDTIAGANGSAVSSVVNSGSLSGTISQGTGSKQPALASGALAGHNAITFDGTSDTLALGGGLLDLARNRSALTVYVLADFTSAVAGIRTLLGLAVGTGSGSRLYVQRTAELTFQAGARRLDADGASAFATSAGTVPYATWFVFTVRFVWSDTDVYLYRDGDPTPIASNTSWLTAGTTSDTASSAGAIGSNAAGSGEFWYGRVARVLAYNGDHTATERATVHSALQTIYGVTVNDYLTPSDEWLLSGDLESA